MNYGSTSMLAQRLALLPASIARASAIVAPAIPPLCQYYHGVTKGAGGLERHACHAGEILALGRQPCAIHMTFLGYRAVLRQRRSTAPIAGWRRSFIPIWPSPMMCVA